mmetsp:Transcript_34692/g.61018  ORF Transcript_34692/g.61018 Transcript_34692/m.61018 type:complete len:580 (+) Transcript_34692:86-1825(+)
MDELKTGIKTLPGDLHTFFKQALRYYDDKNYPKTLKLCEKVIEQAATHGETLVIKALALHYTGKDDESVAIVKSALRHNLSSPACWHAMGFVYKNINSYAEAANCLNKVMKMRPDNFNVLAELASVQIHLRDFQNFRLTRHKLLTERAGFAVNWAGYALAEALNNNNPRAVEVIDSLLNSYGETLKKYDVSEVILFKLTLLPPQSVLTYLPTVRDRVLNRIKLAEIRVDALLKVGNLKAAKVEILKLLKLNPDNEDYHVWLAKTSANLLEDYDQLAAEHPNSQLMKRNPLKLAEGEAFCSRIDAYIKAKLKKGVPSLAADLKSLYSDPFKVKVIEQVAKAHFQSLSSNSSFASIRAFEPELLWSPSDLVEQPPAKLWTVYLLAQHYYRLHDYAQALEYLKEALDHTPTLPDLYMLKAKIHKKQGDAVLAAETSEKGKQLDMNDRFLSNKCAKYWLRAGDVPHALQVMAPFCREQGEELNFHDVQSLWFEAEKAEAHLRAQDWQEAFKEFKFIVKHFEDFKAAQSEFHSYCLRRYNLISYVDFLKFVDSIFTRPQYIRAVEGLHECVAADPSLVMPKLPN